VPGLHLRLAGIALASTAAAILLSPPALASPPATTDEATPCWGDEIAVSSSPTQGAVGHRALSLIFSLIGGEPCTLNGYPVVDTDAGGPPIQAQPTLRGYMGGLPAGVSAPQTVTLSISRQAQAIVEGMAVDGSGNPCPTYTDLSVNLPFVQRTFTVPATIEACQLQVHPITEATDSP
jgi:Protein of unknown function (DUF4232)